MTSMSCLPLLKVPAKRSFDRRLEKTIFYLFFLKNNDEKISNEYAAYRFQGKSLNKKSR